jgi:hypothetical protein
VEKIRTTVLQRLTPVVRKGQTRTVWVFPQLGFAIKFPVFFFRFFFKTLWIEREWKYLKEWLMWEDCVWHSARFYLLKGLLDNWREFLFFVWHRDEPFLFPTYFSFFGLFNITPLGEEIPEEVDLWHFIYKATGGQALRDSHHFTENANFCFYEGHIRIRDYGAKRTQGIITEFREKFNSLPSELILG